jgi:uncharacterized membrane protein (UPF0127 family)
MRTLLILLMILAVSCKEENTKKVLTKEVSFTKEGTLELRATANDSVLAVLEIEIAEDDYEVQTGLMYRKSMRNDRGMLFVFPDERPRSFYMKNTEFALDIIFLDAQKRVVNVQTDAQPLDPTSLPSTGPAMYVLEVNAGLTEQWGLKAGDEMSFNRD